MSQLVCSRRYRKTKERIYTVKDMRRKGITLDMVVGRYVWKRRYCDYCMQHSPYMLSCDSCKKSYNALKRNSSLLILIASLNLLCPIRLRQRFRLKIEQALFICSQHEYCY